MSDTDWMDDALCKEVGLAPFFPEDGENPHWARRVCANCDVTADCRDYALRERIWFGVWGGTTPDERRSMVRRGLTERAA